MSYPTPPSGGNPYGQPPPQSGWQPQGQGAAPVPPPMPAAPPGPPPAAAPAQPGPSPYGGYAAPPANHPVPGGPVPGGAVPGYAVPGGPVPGAPVPPSGGGRTGRKAFGIVLTVFGVLGMLGGGALVAHAYSNAQQVIPNQAYTSVVWRNETTEALFPETIGDPPNYTYEASDKKIAQWNRMGISEDTSCSKGLSGETKEKALELGCEAVLRATYVDLTGEMVATVAIVVMPKDSEAGSELGQYLEDQSGEDVPDAAVVPLKVPGTLAAKWQESRRNGMGGDPVGTYAVAVTTGAVDGRNSANLPGDFGEGVGTVEDRKPWMDEADALATTFGTHIMNLAR
ncbi:hypothetical protein GCM10022233_61660 [Streptomyces shaanxiensis]|uniref:Uncharacterized protein n=1 Tax=Streptomyces shaanxiensis TaxID=653357 RepID=A0ABP7VV84_9ACTN